MSEDIAVYRLLNASMEQKLMGMKADLKALEDQLKAKEDQLKAKDDQMKAIEKENEGLKTLVYSVCPEQ